MIHEEFIYPRLWTRRVLCLVSSDVWGEKDWRFMTLVFKLKGNGMSWKRLAVSDEKVSASE